MGSTTKKEQDHFSSQIVHKYLPETKFSIICEHKLNHLQHLQVDRVFIDQRCFTCPLIILNLDAGHPLANDLNSSKLAFELGIPIAANMQKRVSMMMNYSPPNANLNAMYIKKHTEKLLWHLLCDKYLYKASQSIKGLPQFKLTTSILDTCPTCIRAKQTKAHQQPPPINPSKPKTNHSLKMMGHYKCLTPISRSLHILLLLQNPFIWLKQTRRLQRTEKGICLDPCDRSLYWNKTQQYMHLQSCTRCALAQTSPCTIQPIMPE